MFLTHYFTLHRHPQISMEKLEVFHGVPMVTYPPCTRYQDNWDKYLIHYHPGHQDRCTPCVLQQVQLQQECYGIHTPSVGCQQHLEDYPHSPLCHHIQAECILECYLILASQVCQDNCPTDKEVQKQRKKP